ncbi:hypothetical protein WJX77_009922 [Trebouxia sp. C0004]
MENAFVDAVEAKNFSALLVSAYTTVIDARSSQRLGRFSSLKEHLLLDLLPARLDVWCPWWSSSSRTVSVACLRLTLEEDEQAQTERALLNTGLTGLAMLLAAQESLDNICHTVAFVPADKFHLGTCKQAASADSFDPSDAEELLINPSLPSVTLPTPHAPNAEAEYTTSDSPQPGSGSSISSSSQAECSLRD